MSVEIDLEQIQRRNIRWRILSTLNAGRPGRVNESIILSVCHDSDLPITPHGLRRELDYLRDRELITIFGEQSQLWSADLTRIGIDVVEYEVDCDAGIARPRKW